MLRKPFPIPFDKQMACIAGLTILGGAIVGRFLGWTAAGWMSLILGVQGLFLAHFLATAVPMEDVEVDT